jgi:signal transduction histidine kinase
MTETPVRVRIEEFLGLLTAILQIINQSVSRLDFVERFSSELITTMKCDEVEVRVCEKYTYLQAVTTAGAPPTFTAETLPYPPDRALLPAQPGRDDHEALLARIFAAGPANRAPFGEPGGNDREIVVPLPGNGHARGLLRLASRRPGFFTPDDFTEFSAVAELLAGALGHQRSMVALHERVKELSCLYDMMKVFGRADSPLDRMLAEVANLVGPAFRYPEIAHCRLVLDEQEYRSEGYRPGESFLQAPIEAGPRRGRIEVGYADHRPIRDQGPFLDEESNLLSAVARHIGLVIEEKDRVQERVDLQAQLHHADRLATIGQLAAGVAHEINEPLAGVLGFAQLVLKDDSLSDQARRDVEKIRDAALHSREVVKKLLLFGRQLPPQKEDVAPADIVADALGLLQGRFDKAGVTVRLVDPGDTPSLPADRGQLTQVAMNLLVNALQAMPDGGALTIEIGGDNDRVRLVFRDTGVGMNEQVRREIFQPFFTTKLANEGTGLGLAVAQRIVEEHHGTISVESAPGVGSTFTIELPVRREV